MDIEKIGAVAQKIKLKYAENDPFKLCKQLGITLLYEPMGNFEGACKGFYFIQSRIQVIVINSDLPRLIQRIILTHEIGHCLLHKKLSGINAFHEFILFDETSKLEYEANIFTAEFLLDDDDVINLLNEDMSFFKAASTLNVPPELLDFKFRVLKRKGYKVIDPPTYAQSDFLKRDLGGENSDYEF